MDERPNDDQREGSGDGPAVRAHRSRPDRTVFTEAGNEDGWLSTDLTVTVRR
ncbi:MAG: hypothetical protein ABEJ04_06885 [Halobacteriaceae archaeon]